MSRLPDFAIMPVDDDSEYVKHVYLILMLWTVFVVVSGAGLAVVALT